MTLHVGWEMAWLAVGIAVACLVYAAVIVPARRLRRLQRSLRRTDEVVTSCGMYGQILEIHGDVVTLQVGTGVVVRVLRSHVRARWDR